MQGVNISIKNTTTNKYWTGSEWSDTTTWIDASANDSSFDSTNEDWTNNTSSITWSTGSYLVQANSTDIFGNDDSGSVASDTFTISAVNEAPYHEADTQDPYPEATAVCYQPALYTIVKDNDTADTMNATWYSNSTGSWIQIGVTETGIGDGNNITTSGTNFTDAGTDYWWAVNISDGTDYANVSYKLTLNAEPTQSGPAPYDTATNICIKPTIYIIPSDTDTGQTFTIKWMSNSSGTWKEFETDTSIAIDANTSASAVNFTTAGADYWWSANVSDTCSNWSNTSYKLTINSVPTQAGADPYDTATAICYQPTIYII